MARSITANTQAQLDATQVQPFVLFEGEFQSGILRTWSGFGDLAWNGYTWIGAGNLLAVSPLTETSDISAQGMSVTLSGIPSDMLSLALNDVEQGAYGKVWLGFMSNNAVVSDPVLMFEGNLDVPTIDDMGETASISISYESRLIDLQRPRVSRYTDEEQRRVYPSDLGCEYVISLQEKEITWGRA